MSSMRSRNRPPRLARALPGDARRIGVAEMQLAGRAGGKTRDDGTSPTRRYAKPMAQIVLDAANLKKAMRHLAKVDPDFARAIKEVGHPELRVVPSGFGGLMRSIVGQQVSVHAARAIWLRLEAADADDGAGRVPEAHRRAAARRRPLQRQDEVRPLARHRHRRGPHRFRRRCTSSTTRRPSPC